MLNVSLKLGTAARSIPVAPAPAARLTQARVKAELAALGITFRRTPGENEYRVNYPGSSEDTAAYETDLESALDTGKAMAAYQEKARFKPANVNAAAREPAPVEPTTYRLGSSDMVFAPGIVAWAQNGWHFPKDRAAILPVIRDTWSLPEAVAIAILEGRGETVGDTYTITI